MNTHDLFLSCRRGDLTKIRYLVEQKEINLNIRDKWDSSPLYYACLCGHEEVVKYLLENGARCEVNTFDGERCLYGALTDQIKRLLLKYNMVSSKVMRRDMYEEFLRKLFEYDQYKNVTFHVHGHTFQVHRFVLSARSSFFSLMFKSRWKDRSDIHLKHPKIAPKAFQKILQFLYTGQLEVHIESLQDVFFLARQCHLDQLVATIDDKYKQLADYESTKPGVNITMLVVDQTDNRELQLDLGVLADLALPQELCALGNGELPFEPERELNYADIIFVVDGHKFFCHKSFFCGRSDYFKARVSDHFCEDSLSEENFPVLTLTDIDVQVFVQVLYYIYQDTCQLTEENVYDVMCAGDLYLLPGLKRYCANMMAQYLTVSDVIMILRTARMFNLPRLEDQCAEFMAKNLEQILDLEEFEQLVKEDASEIKSREQTDSIDIIDSIRFHMTNFVQTYSEMQEAENQIRQLDDFLSRIGLEC